VHVPSAFESRIHLREAGHMDGTTIAIADDGGRMSILSAYEWPFVIAIVLAALLVLGATSGFGDLVTIDADGDGIPDALDGIESVLSVLGFGRAPFAVSLVLILGLFGGSGLVASPFVAHLPVVVGGTIAWSVALTTSLVGHRLLAGIVGRLVPNVETYASRTRDRLGRVGYVVIRLGERNAIVRMHLADGTMLRIPAHSDEPMPPVGSAVIVVDHDERSHSDLVVSLPAEASWPSSDGTNEKEIIR